MIITCAECNSSFNVNDGLIKESGSKVRCSKCDSVFVAYPQASDDDLDLDLDFGQDDGSDLALSEETAVGDELPDLDDLDDLGDLEDLGGLDDAALTEEAEESDFEGLELEIEDEGAGQTANAQLELEEEEGLELSDLGFEEEDIGAVKELSDADTEESAPGMDLELDAADQDDGQLAGENSAEAGEDELDLSDLEWALDNDARNDPFMMEKTENLNLVDLDAEESPGIDEDSDAVPELQEADQLDLSDLELDMEEAAVSEDSAAAGSDDSDFDLDFDLETAAGADESGAETQMADSGGDELDLSDLTDIMDEETAPAADSQPDELNLELELESGGQTDEAPLADSDDSEGMDELDLSDLDGIMEASESPANQNSADDTQNLELDLDLGMEESPSTADAAAGAGDELDFSDLEQLLESDETPTIEAADANNTDALELELDLDEITADSAPAAAADQDAGVADDEDFLDIEQMLEAGESPTSELEVDQTPEVTDLPLEMESALDDASKGAEAELELDFDLESELQEKEDMFDDGSSGAQLAESNLFESDEPDFLEEAASQDAPFQDGAQASAISTDDFASDDLSGTQSAYGATHVLAGDEDELPPEPEEFYEEAPVARKTRSRSKKPVVVILLLLILAAGVLVVPNMLGIKIPYVSDIKIPYISDLNVRIPYLSDWLNPEAQDVAGNLKLFPLNKTINGKFIDNSRAGQIFVIQGQIKNDYSHPRSHIKVTGKLYQKGNRMAKAATVYCGNVLSDSDLAALDIAAIRKKLMNEAGERRSNLKVQTGKTVPFMIVFDDLPKNLDEFSVEVEGSSI